MEEMLTDREIVDHVQHMGCEEMDVQLIESDDDGVEWVMLNVAHVRFRPYPEMFGGILGSLDSVLPPGFFPSFVKFRQNLNLNLVRFELTSHWSA